MHTHTSPHRRLRSSRPLYHRPGLVARQGLATQCVPRRDFRYHGMATGYGPENVDPVVQKTTQYLREANGIEKVGGVDYYFGRKVTLRDQKTVQ